MNWPIIARIKRFHSHRLPVEYNALQVREVKDKYADSENVECATC